MKIKYNGVSVELIQGDITSQDADAIVNAANSALSVGAGVCGAIHRMGGPTIYNECLHIGGCETGNAVITGGGNLPARYVIHAVGPVYRGGTNQEARKLSSSYRRSLEVASENNLQSIAFPSIGTGIYGYPVVEAAEVALRAVQEVLQHPSSIQLVRFILFDESTYRAYEEALRKVFGERQASNLSTVSHF